MVISDGAFFFREGNYSRSDYHLQSEQISNADHCGLLITDTGGP